jgi:hypothetical protein
MDWSSSQVGYKTNSRLADDPGIIRGLEFEDAGCGPFYGVPIGLQVALPPNNVQSERYALDRTFPRDE